MTARLSRGYCVRISVSSATATFFAARKQPRRSIERLMSTSSTVEVGVVRSVRIDLEVVGSQPDRRARRAHGRARSPRAPSAFESVAAQVEMERVAELERLRSSPRAPLPGPCARAGGRRTRRAGAARTARRAPSGRSAGCRAASAPAARRRASGSPPPRAAGPGRRARRGRARRRRRAGRGPRRDRCPRGRPARPTPSSASSSRSSAWSRPICSSAASRPERLVAAERAPARRARPAAAGRGSRRAGRDPTAAGRRGGARPSSILELRALLRRQRPHERLHRRHPLGELLDDVVERAGAREERRRAWRGTRRPRPGRARRPSSRRGAAR